MNNKGFTLIELMVVALLICALSTIAIMMHSHYTAKAKEVKVVVETRNAELTDAADKL